MSTGGFLFSFTQRHLYSGFSLGLQEAWSCCCKQSYTGGCCAVGYLAPPVTARALCCPSPWQMAGGRSQQTAASSGSACRESSFTQISAGEPTWEHGTKQAQEQTSGGLASPPSRLGENGVCGSVLMQGERYFPRQGSFLPSQRCACHSIPMHSKPQVTKRPLLSGRVPHAREKDLCKICLFSARLSSFLFLLCIYPKSQSTGTAQKEQGKIISLSEPETPSPHCG